MKRMYKFVWEDGTTEFMMAESNIDAINKAFEGRHGQGFCKLTEYRIVMTMTYSRIATELQLTTTEVNLLFMGLFGNPKLGESLHVERRNSAKENLVPNNQAKIFINNVHKFFEDGGEINNPA